jgi:hypothetical protein
VRHDGGVLPFRGSSRDDRMRPRVGGARIRVALLAVAVAVALAGIGRGSQPAASAASFPVVRVGPLRLLVASHEAGDPYLAMDQTGRYLLTWPGQQQWGPFFRVEGTLSSRLRVTGAAGRYGGGVDFDPLLPALGADGERAVMYGVRRQHGAQHVFFGVGLTEAAPGSNKWVTRQLELPPASVDANGGVALDGHGKLMADWSVSGRHGDHLVLAQQSRPGGPLRLRTALTDPKQLPLVALAPAFDSSGGVIAPFDAASLSCGGVLVARDSSRSSSCKPVPERAMVFTSSTAGRSQVQLIAAGCDEERFVAGPGTMAAILLRCGLRGGGTQLRVSERRPDGSFGPPIPVSSAGKTANIASTTMRIAADGTVWVAWDYQKPQHDISKFFWIRTDIASAHYGAAFGAPQWATAYTKDFVDEVSEPTLLAGASGSVYLLSQNPHFALVVQAVGQPGALGPAIRISPDDIQPVVAQTDARGFAIAMWSHIPTSDDGHILNQIEARELELP